MKIYLEIKGKGVILVPGFATSKTIPITTNNNSCKMRDIFLSLLS